MNRKEKCPVAMKNSYADIISSIPNKGFVDRFDIQYIDYDDLERDIEGNQPSAYTSVFALIAGTERWNEERLKTMPHLHMIARAGSGVDGIDFDYCNFHNIDITTCPSVVADAVAEFTMRHIVDATDWRGTHKGRMLFSELSVGIIGCGHVGSRVKTMCESLNIPTHVFDIDPMLGCDNVEDLDAALSGNVVTWHIPYRSEVVDNAHVINADVLSRINGQTVTLLNFSRPGLFDPVALCAFCGQRRLGGLYTSIYIDGTWDCRRFGSLTRLGNYAGTYPSMIHEYQHIASCTDTTRMSMVKSALLSIWSRWEQENP